MAGVSKFIKQITDIKPSRVINQKVIPAISEAGKVTGRAIKATPKAINDGVNTSLSAGADFVVDKGVKYGVKGAKAMVKKDPKGAHFLNGYTGLRESKTLIGTTAVLGTGYAGTASTIRSSMYEKPGQTSYAGEAPIMNADAVGSTSPSSSSAPTLGATGSMVFGLHNSRKG